MRLIRGVVKSSSAASRRRAATSGILLALGIACAGLAGAHEGESPTAPSASLPPIDPARIDPARQETAKGHGSISFDYQNTFVNGFRLDNSLTVPIASVRIRSVSLDLDYYFADRWSVHAGIPFVSNRFTGGAPHCPTTAPPQCAGAPVLTQQHPESQFLDDGQYHGALQDWNLGVSYHTHLGDYYFTPSLTYYRPTHDYTFFANAAVGQHLWQLQPAIELTHQFELSNFYYRVRYGYVFVQKTQNISINHHRVDLELGYFLNDRCSIRAFAIGKKGHGLLARELLPITENQTNEYWYHHDQTARHDYAAAGLGLDYRLGDKYTLSTSVQKLIWGQTVFNFRYSFDLRLTREF